LPVTFLILDRPQLQLKPRNIPRKKVTANTMSTKYNSSGSAVKLKPTISDEVTLKISPDTGNKNMSSVFQEIEHRSSSSNGNQSKSNITTGQLRQQMDHIIADAAFVKYDDRNWPSGEIASGNDSKILQHGIDRNDVSGQRYAI